MSLGLSRESPAPTAPDSIGAACRAGTAEGINAERLLTLYDRVADAPDAVPRLRRFALDLAVRGKLVEQDSADEPASELLKRIAEEKSRLKDQHHVKRLSMGEIPFSLPVGWLWSRIGELCTKTGSGSTPRGGKNVYKKVGIPFLRSQNVYDDGLRLDDVACIEPDIHARMAGTAVRSRDLLLNITGGSMGRCCRVPDEFGEANVSQHVAIIRLAVSEMADFLHALVLSPYFQALIFDEQTGAGRGGLPKYKMDRISVAVPPLAEQRRIVAKVDELMALCDRLEEARTVREGTRDRLTKASYARLSVSDVDDVTFRSNARFAIDALPALTARADQVKHLRQIILNLAVRGKLVEQDPADEPASEMLKRLAAKKTTSFKWQESSPDFDASKLRHIPKNWCRLRVREILDFRYGKGLKAGDRTNDGPVPVYGSNGIVGYTTEPLTVRPAVIVGRKGSAGALNKCNGPSWTTDVAYFVEAPDFFDLDFLFFSLTALDLSKLGKGVKPGLSRMDAYCKLIFIPPLAEQHRIVKKVNDLMGLCDRLDAGLGAVDTGRHHLLESLLCEALEPPAKEMACG